MVQRLREQGDDSFNQGGWRVERVRMGMNNALYRVEGEGQVFAVKLCVDDERRRAQREYAALRLLWQAGADIAPQPLGLDESAAILPYPAVVYRWLPGEPLSEELSGGKLPGRKLAALLETVQLVHRIEPAGFENQEEAGLPEAWFHWFERQPYLEELNGFLEQYRSWLCENIAKGEAICARLERIVTACTRAVNDSSAKINRGSVPLRLCHVDPNPANLIWSEDGRLRWVDWEYSGWGDPALDLADFRWHQALSFIGPEQAAWMRAHYQPPLGDDGFAQRLRLWDTLLAARWPFLLLRWLWSLQNGPDRERLSMPQAQATEVYQQMVRLIERAEGFYQSVV